MSDPLVNRLLGGGDRDPGCDACFEILDQYAEAVLSRPDADRLFPEVVAHLAGCAACREDTEGLIAALRAGAPPRDPK
jgi:hypothetical protein